MPSSSIWLQAFVVCLGLSFSVSRAYSQACEWEKLQATEKDLPNAIIVGDDETPQQAFQRSYGCDPSISL